MTANYSYSHSLDDSSAETGYTATYSGNPNLDYAYSDQDPRNNFSLKLSYAIPGRKAPGQMLEGWEVNTVVHAIGGVPFDSYDTSNDLFGTGGRRPGRWSAAPTTSWPARRKDCRVTVLPRAPSPRPLMRPANLLALR